ncbi:MAG: PP2C family protein-serine/threonine phosphatase [Terracidiphilus sp.]
MIDVSPWRNTPRRSIIIALLAVFLTFTTMGFVSDIVNVGRQSTLKFALTVVLSGLFAIVYAVTGVTLRSRWWMGTIPVFAVQFVVMSAVGHWLPDAPQQTQMNVAETQHVRDRLAFDCTAIMIAVCLGYTGFVYVFVTESRRHIHAHTEKALLEAEIAAAREVQQVIVPEKSEPFPGYVVESVYQPATQVGGDFFQVLPAGDDGLLIVVGDVAGKGLPAAMLVSMLVGSIRTVAEDSSDPVLMLRRLHVRLVGRSMGGFATAVAALVSGDGVVTIANAGHLSPYLDGKEMELPGALPLGIADSGKFETRQFELRPGSRLTFYSDGVVEAQNKSGELFGFERAKAISTQSAAAIVAAAVKFGQEDDITVVTIERLAASDVPVRMEPLPPAV